MKYSDKFARRFLRSYKRLHPNQLRAVHESLDQILQEPVIGQIKKGDLKELSVCKFLLLGQNFLIAYTINDLKKEITFESVGLHENFYHDPKR